MPQHESWEPHSRPIHKLLLTLDVLAIAVNRFRQLSFKMNEWNDETRALYHRSGDEWAEIKTRVFAEPGIRRLVNECVGETHTWSGDCTAIIENAAQWIADFTLGWPARWPNRTPYPHSTIEESIADTKLEQQFYAQGEHLLQAREHRDRLLRLLARHGENIPLLVERRENLYHLALTNPVDENSVSQKELLAFLDEAVPPPPSQTLKLVYEPGEEIPIPGFNPERGDIIIGLPSLIERNSEAWNRLPEESKAMIERNDASCRRRNDLLETSAGRLQLFLEDFRSDRSRMTEKGAIDPKRYKIEECCLKWWNAAREHREGHPIGTLDALPPRPEGFENSFSVQNALDALEAWVEESLKRLGLFEGKFRQKLDSLIVAYGKAHSALTAVASEMDGRPQWEQDKPPLGAPAVKACFDKWQEAALMARELSQANSHWLPGFAKFLGEDWIQNPVPELSFGLQTGPNDYRSVEIYQMANAILERWKALERLANRAKAREGEGENYGAMPPTPRASSEETCASFPANAGGKPPKKRKGGGRKPSNLKTDARIQSAWDSGHHSDYAGLATALGITKSEVEAAMDRERKRRKKVEAASVVNPS